MLVGATAPFLNGSLIISCWVGATCPLIPTVVVEVILVISFIQKKNYLHTSILVKKIDSVECIQICLSL